MTKPDAVTVVIPVHNAADRLDKVGGWRVALEKAGRAFEILAVDDGSTDGTGEKLAAREPKARVLRHDTRQGFGACLRTALAEARHPLLFYTAFDYPYTPSDVRNLLARIDLRDEVLGRPPDLVSGCRTGLQAPLPVRWAGRAWRLFWRVFAGMPMADPAPWHGWDQFRFRTRAGWVYGVPLADVNSCFKLYRTAFLRRFPIQSDGDFVHAELVAKATFLTSVMDEVPLTPKPDRPPPIGDTRADRRRVSASRARFAFPAKTEAPAADPGSPMSEGPALAPVADTPGSPAPAP